jgi:hypothetical protein
MQLTLRARQHGKHEENDLHHDIDDLICVASKRVERHVKLCAFLQFNSSLAWRLGARRQRVEGLRAWGNMMYLSMWARLDSMLVMFAGVW